ncbi:MAG: hypothetical protein E7559_02880 [Ruminococcaceae bacterium]|nr:hypothetical protein [Oscillospiraceae bacterium]
MKCVKAVVALLWLMCAFAAPAVAEVTDTEIILEQQRQAGGSYLLEEALPKETAEALEEAGITQQGMEQGISVSYESITDLLTETAKESSTAPIAACAVTAGLVVLCALIEGLRSSFADSKLAAPAAAAATIAICTAAAAPVAMHIADAGRTMEGMCGFGAVFVPVFAAACAAGGHPLAASGYNAFMLGLNSGINVVISQAVLPLLRIFLAISTASALSPTLRLEGLTEFIEKRVKWLLGLLAMLFTGFLGVTSAVSAAADKASGKALKFLVSGTVPVIGGAISDALASVQGCLSVMRASVGGFGIIAIAFICLPPLIRTVIWLLGMELCRMLADMLEVKSASRLLRAVTASLEVMLSLLLFCAAVLIVSSAILLGSVG